MPTVSKTDRETENPALPALAVLQACDIAAIDQALKEIGPFGEVHLVVEKGHLRFIRTVRSEPIVAGPSGVSSAPLEPQKPTAPHNPRLRSG